MTDQPVGLPRRVRDAAAPPLAHAIANYVVLIRRLPVLGVRGFTAAHVGIAAAALTFGPADGAPESPTGSDEASGCAVDIQRLEQRRTSLLLPRLKVRLFSSASFHAHVRLFPADPAAFLLSTHPLGSPVCMSAGLPSSDAWAVGMLFT